MFENRVKHEIFGVKRGVVTRYSGDLRDESLHDLQSSPVFVWVIKSWIMRWVGRVERMGQKCRRSFGGENMNEKDHLDDLRVGGNIILRWKFRKWAGKV